MQEQSQKRKGWGRTVIIGLALILASILLGTALLTLVFSIPTHAIAQNAEKSLEQIDQTAAALKAKGSNLTFAEWLRYYVDFYTEKVMISSALNSNPGYNALQAAMDINGYARYWHGYLILVRPLLLLTGYRGLVTLNVTAFLLLFGFLAYRLIQRCNALTAFALLLSFIITRVVSLILCLSFSVSFIFAMLLMIAVSYFAGHSKERILPLLFLCSGIGIAYFEQLMTPLVALGLPLLLYLAIKLKDDAAYSLGNGLSETIQFSAAWAIGYGVFWAAKWAIGSLVLERNVLQDAVSTMSFRMVGSAQIIASPLHAIGLNLGQMVYHRPLVFLIAGTLAVAVALVLHKPWREWLRALPLLAVSAYPIIWMFVLANHSETHYYFTFRITTILLFGVGVYLLHCCDFQKIKRLFQTRPSK